MTEPRAAKPDTASRAKQRRSGKPGKKFLAGFTAVDLVTIAAFAAAARISHLIQKFFNFAFPLNVAFWYVFFGWALAAVVVLVPKRGTAALYAGLSVLAINILVEGDPPQWLLTVPVAIVVTELIFWAVQRVGGSYCATLKTSLVGLTLAAPVWWLAMVYFGLHMIFGVPMGTAAILVTLGVFIVSAPVVAFAGHKVGKSLQPLLTS
jgi:hypothetical protein